MKAIKIDVIKCEVYEIDIKEGVGDLERELCTDTFWYAYVRHNRDCVYIDDEGLLKEHPIGAFTISEFYQPLSGHAVITGTDLAGKMIPCKSTVEEIKAMVKFVPVQMLAGIPRKPHIVTLTEEEAREYLRTGKLPLGKGYINPQ